MRIPLMVVLLFLMFGSAFAQTAVSPGAEDSQSAFDQPLAKQSNGIEQVQSHVSPVHVADLPTEVTQIANKVSQACKSMEVPEQIKNLDETLSDYDAGSGEHLVVFQPGKICTTHGDGACSTDGCDVYFYVGFPEEEWKLATKQTVFDIVKNDKVRTPLTFLVNLRGGVPPCRRATTSTCSFEMEWYAGEFRWKRFH